MKKIRLGLMAGLTGLVSPSVSHAQQSADTASADAEATAGDIVVTARRRTETAISVPMMVSVVGRSFFGKPGVFYRVLSLLNEERISVLQTSDSDFSVSCLIPETETNRAVRVLHDHLVPAQVGE